jgi:two-component system cell cycle sensor histidine kinase PleC
MFSYLRYFSVISAVIITLAAIGLGYYFRSSAGDDLRDVAIKNNKVLVQGFINKVWKEHEMVKMLTLFRKHNIAPEDWHRYRGYKEKYEGFRREVFSYFEEMPVVHVTLYDSEGRSLLSFNQSQILQPDAVGVKLQNPPMANAAVQQAVDGTTASNILENSRFRMADGAQHEGTLVQTTVPIISDNYVPLVAGASEYNKASNIEGVVEIYYDITRQWQQLSQFQYVGTGAILLIFLLLIATLIIVAAKAESIIAKQHDSNLELAAQAAAAKAENENKSQFLASISHELRTPLNAIIGFSEIIKNESMGPLGNEQYQDYIRDIHNSGVHLLSLINDILDYSKAEAGKLELNLEEIDLTKAIHSSMRLVAPRAEHAKVNLVTEIPKEHYLLHTDSKKIKQVMLNLLSNAVKFTPEKGEVKVTMWQEVLENRITIEVSDSGIGIAPKDISKALSPFGQVDSALSRKYEGTGLGLPLTKKFVEIMGGIFEIESEEGQGTKVRFSLPMNAPLPEDNPAPESSAEEAPAPEPEQVESFQPPLVQAEDSKTPLFEPDALEISAEPDVSVQQESAQEDPPGDMCFGGSTTPGAFEMADVPRASSDNARESGENPSFSFHKAEEPAPPAFELSDEQPRDEGGLEVPPEIAREFQAEPEDMPPAEELVQEPAPEPEPLIEPQPEAQEEIPPTPHEPLSLEPEPQPDLPAEQQEAEAVEPSIEPTPSEEPANTSAPSLNTPTEIDTPSEPVRRFTFSVAEPSSDAKQGSTASTEAPATGAPEKPVFAADAFDVASDEAAEDKPA